MNAIRNVIWLLIRRLGPRLVVLVPGAGKVVGTIRYLRELVLAHFDSKWRVHSDTRILFLDLGSNVGQSFGFFSKIFRRGLVTFELFEPNPNCFEFLNRAISQYSGMATLHPYAVGTDNERALLYGLDAFEGGRLSQGASLLYDHNSSLYRVSKDKAVGVGVIDFSEFLENRRGKFDTVIVKMDIEGAEIDVLRHLIATRSIEVIDVLYVEFHSAYLSGPKSKETLAQELNIIRTLKEIRSLRFREWH